LGARNRVPMARLRELCEASGATNARTYIASGNVVLDSQHPAQAVATELERAIKSEFGISIAVVVLTASDFAAVVTRNPFSNAAPNTLYVAFAAKPIGKSAAADLEALDFAQEKLAVHGRQIYMHLLNGYGRVRLPVEVNRHAGQPITVRNWRTVTTLRDLAANTISE
ncbi:MAG: DUF1697 domain-containing protein, partial [Candidatus Limnocylindrales bacterium]